MEKRDIICKKNKKNQDKIMKLHDLLGNIILVITNH